MLFISTSGHGYLKVTHGQLKKAISTGWKPSSYSFINKRCALLEEDCDAPEFLRAANLWHKRGDIQVKHQDDINYTCYHSMNSLNYYIK